MSQEVSKKGLFGFLKQLTIVAEWDVIKWAFAQAWEIDKGNMIFWTILNTLGALIPILVLKITEQVVNSITETVAVAGNITEITWRIGVLTLLWVLQSSYNIIPQIIKYTMQTRYSIAMQGRYAACVNKIPLNKFDEKEFSAQISHVGSTCTRLAYFVGGMTRLIGTIVGISGLLWLAFNTSWIFLLIAVIAIIILLALSTSVVQSHSDFWQVAKMERRKQQYYSGLLTGRESGREIRAMRTAGFFKDRWHSLLEKLTNMEIDLSMKNQHIINTLVLLQIIFSIAILAVGVWLLWQGNIQLGALVMLWQLSSQLFGAIQRLANDYHYPLVYYI